MRTATGFYIGDGLPARRIVTGLSGELTNARIINDAGQGPAFKNPLGPLPPANFADEVSGVNGGNCFLFDGPDFIMDGTVGAAVYVNAAGFFYWWQAWSE